MGEQGYPKARHGNKDDAETVLRMRSHTWLWSKSRVRKVYLEVLCLRAQRTPPARCARGGDKFPHHVEPLPNAAPWIPPPP